MEHKSKKLISSNKKAFHDYFIDEKMEAGIELFGTEVKSVRAGTVNLKDSYVSLRTGEAILIGMHISPYEQGNIFNRDPLRDRRLLLHKKEIMRLIGKTKEKGYSLIPLSLYLKKGKVKVALGLARGKKLYDKRQDLKEKAVKRDMERMMKP